MKFTFEVDQDLDALCDSILDIVDMGKISEAKKMIEELFLEYPHYYMVHYVLGVCFAKEEKLSEAIAHFEKAVETCPLFSEAYYNLAVSYVKNIQIGAAVDAFKRVIELDEKLECLGKNAQEELDRLDSLMQETSGCALDEYMHRETLFNQAFECLAQEKYQRAIALFEQVIALDNEHVQSHGNIGIAYFKLRNKKKAIEYFDKALALDPQYEPAFYNKIATLFLDDDEVSTVHMRTTKYYKDGIVS